MNFQFTSGFFPFWDLGNVLSPEGTLLCRVPKEVQLFLLMYYCLRKRILDFQFMDNFLPFWDLENVLSPEGTLHSRVPKEVQLFLLMSYFGLGKVYWISKTDRVYRVFLRENVSFDGMELMGRVGRWSKMSFNFFHFEIY